jgi:hypothetical protein
MPLVVGAVYAGKEDETFAEAEGASWALSWFERGDARRSR